MTPNQSFTRWFLIIAILSAFLWGVFKLREESHANRILGLIPAELNVSTILYVTEESWGFGPGGNETGVFVYELPDSSTQGLRRTGIEHLSAMDTRGEDGRPWFGKWQQTPVLLDGSDSGTNSTRSYEIANYLNRYGYGISIDPKIEQEINEAISKPGSFVAHGRSGILIVVPATRRVVYAYNG